MMCTSESKFREHAGAKGKLVGLLEACLDAYLSPRLPMRQHYQASSDAMHGMRFEAGFVSPLALPAAFLFSEADTVTNVNDIRIVCDKWRAAGCEVQEAVFEGTAHVSHLPAFPICYEQTVAGIIKRAFGETYAD